MEKKMSKKKKEENLKKLARTSILMNFVKKNHGSWDHNLWKELCEKITAKGYKPIDFDQVGVLLEEKKEKYFDSKKKKL